MRPVVQRVEVELTHLGDTVRQVLHRPVVSGNRRIDHDVHGAGIERRGVAGGDDLRVADHDRHDRDSGRHRDAERPLLERAHFGGVESGALRRDQNGQAFTRKLFNLFQAFHCCLGVVSVDEGNVHHLAECAGDRIALQFLLADGREVDVHQPARDDRINLVAVIEDKHRGPLGGQVLLPEQIDIHASCGQQHATERRREEVDSGALVASQQAQAQSPSRNGNHRCDAYRGAKLRHRIAPTAAAEPQHRPTAFGRNSSQLSRRIGGPRIADQVHQRDVLVAVGVEIALREIDAILGGEGLHRSGLARPPDDRCLHFAGDQSIVVGHEFVAQHVLDAEEPRHRLHLDRQRRGAEYDGVSALHVSTHQVAHLRVDAADDLLHEEALGEFVDVAERAAAQHAGALADEVLELRPAELVVETGLHHADELADAHLPAPQPIPRHDHAGEPGHQGAVEVEERADLGTRRAALDLCDRAGQPHRAGIGASRCLAVSGRHWALLPFGDGRLGCSTLDVNEAGAERPSPPSVSTSSNPACRQRANKSPSVTAARS